MIDELIADASRMWPHWFDGEMARRLQVGILAGRPSHTARALVFLAPGQTRSVVVLKIALDNQEAESLRDEHRALRAVRASVPAGLRTSIPEPLGEWSVPGATVLAVRGMKGRRLIAPPLVSEGTAASRFLLRTFLRRAFRWSDQLGRTTARGSLADSGELVELVERFGRSFVLGPHVAAALASFTRALARMRIRWAPGWQHADVGFGNALMYRGRLRFVDWEHARPSSEPWFDLAYAPATLAGLAQRQGGFASIRAAALATLEPGCWVGSIARNEMERAWTFPLPLSWAVATTAMWKALRLRSEGREGWADFVSVLLADREFRQRVRWLAPEW